LFFVLSILLPLLGVARPLTPFVMLGPCLAALGLPLLLLALLPEDTYLVPLVIFVCHLLYILFFLVFGALTGVSLMGVIDVTDAPAWFRYCTSAWYGLLAGSYIVCACRTRGAWNADKSPHNILADAWRTLGLWFFSLALLMEFAALPRLAFDSKWKSSVEFVVLQTVSFELVAMGALARWPEFRMRMQALLASRGEGISAAAGISAIIGQASVESLLEVWETRFCGVDMDRVTRESMASNMPDPSLGALSRSVDFGAVDAFLSHSWHDDADSKWGAVQRWRSDFVAKFGREPVAWIDKYCIDQKAIEDSLVCLPLFLCGCTKLVIFYGPTYPSRLWCVVELFVALQMGKGIHDIELHELPSSSPFDDFDAVHAQCFDPKDREKMMTLIEAGCGRIEVFNDRVREVLKQCQDANARLTRQQKRGSGLSLLRRKISEEEFN